MSNLSLPPQPLSGKDIKMFRRSADYSYEFLSELIGISSYKIREWENGKNKDLKIPEDIESRLWSLMLQETYLPNRFLDDFLDSLVESYKIATIEGWEHFNDIYVDPSEFDDLDGDKTTFFSDVAKTEPSIIIGQRGTGKSTLFAGLTAYIFDCNKQSNNNKSLVAYIDARAFDAALNNMARKNLTVDLEVNDGDLSQVVLQVLIAAIIKDAPKRYHAVRRNIIGVIAKDLDADVGDFETLWDDLQEAIDFECIENLGTVVKETDTEETCLNDEVSNRIMSPGEKIQEFDRKLANRENVIKKTLFTQAVIQNIRLVLEKLGYQRVYICIDDFSLISENNRERLWKVIRDQYLSSDFLIFKIATYPGTNYGFDNPNFEDATPLYVDQFRHREWLEQNFSSEDKVGTNYFQRVLTKRLKSKGLLWEQVFETQANSEEAKELCRRLYYTSSGLTRNAGMVLRQTKEGMRRNLNSKINATNLGFRGRTFYESYLHHRLPSRIFFMEDEDEKAHVARLLQRILDRLVEEFQDQESDSQLPTTDYFHSSFAVKRNGAENLLQPLAHIGYIMKRFECGDIEEENGERHFYKEYSVYSLNYGLVKRNKLIWDEQKTLKNTSVKFHDKEFLTACEKTDEIIANKFGAELLEQFKKNKWL